MIADLKQMALFSSYSHADDKNTGEPTEEATAIAEICRCLALFTKPGQKVELRAFTPSAATTHGTDHKKLAPALTPLEIFRGWLLDWPASLQRLLHEVEKPQLWQMLRGLVLRRAPDLRS